MSLFSKIHTSLQNDGIAQTVRRSLRRARESLNPRVSRAGATPADVFTHIYERNEWRNGESVSGHGSSLEYTANLRKELPAFFARHGISSIFDAPCGDFNWMKLVVEECAISYHGGDIVRELVEINRRRFGGGRIGFSRCDITVDEFPRADLWFCRDCLFHLSYADICRALENFSRSPIPLLLTTTHLNPRRIPNRDIRSGGYRELDLFSPPFLFPAEVKHRMADWIEPFPPREMCLWTREQIAAVVPAIRRQVGVNS